MKDIIFKILWGIIALLFAGKLGQIAKDYVATIAKKCRSATKRRANAANNNSGTTVGQKTEVDNKEVYDCIIENLTK